MALAFEGPLKGSSTCNKQLSLRFAGRDAAIVVSESGILFAGQTEVPETGKVNATSRRRRIRAAHAPDLHRHRRGDQPELGVPGFRGLRVFRPGGRTRRPGSAAGSPSIVALVTPFPAAGPAASSPDIRVFRA
jgi:hypothetical protein